MNLRWLNSLGVRIALYLIGTLMLAQVASIALLVGDHDTGRSRELAMNFFRNTAVLEAVANRTRGPDLRSNLRSTNRAEMGFWISPKPVLEPDAGEWRTEWWQSPKAAWGEVSARDKRVKWFPDVRPLWMRYRLVNFGGPNGLGGPGGGPGGPGGPGQVRPEQPAGPGPNAPPGPPGDGRPPGAGPPPPSEPREQLDFGEATTLDPNAQAKSSPVMWRVSVQLDDGQWLNGDYRQQAGLPPWMDFVVQQNLLFLAAMLIAIVLSVGFATKRLRLLASAADKVGRGENLDPIPESGASEVRHLTHSFNTMSLRLRRFIEARTQMLGAISHDLRTPITGLRLRAELVDDDENRERMLAIVDEIHHLTEATLALARDDSFTEITDRVDVSSLIESICDDLTDVGIDVSCDVDRGVSLNCRPFSLRRAIRNLAENGAKYGHRSRIRMENGGQSIQIMIDDDGPGIPEDQLDRVLLPFVRLETSRSRATGGAGLGLAITRSIVLNHGGELELKNRTEGGLRATITLPVGA